MDTQDPVAEFTTIARIVAGGLAALATSLVLMACSDAKPVAYYKAKPQERAVRVERCVASGSVTQDCLNAKQAEFEVRGIPAENGRALSR